LVLRKALSKRADERYPSSREFAHTLETAAFGRWAEVTPRPQDVSRLVALAEASISQGSVAEAPGPGVAVDGTADHQGAVAEDPVPSTLLSADLLHTAEQTAAQVIPAWRRPNVALAGATALVLVVAALFLLRSSNAAHIALPGAAPGLLPAAQAEVATQLPPRAPTTGATPPVVSQMPAAAGPEWPAASSHARAKLKGKAARAPGMTTLSTKSTARAKAPNPQNKPRIFKEL
jgi:hypothetical protein